mgnify:CR=1 FL=1
MKIAVIAGDGIGTEVMAEGLKVLRAVRDDVETTEYDLGAARWHRTGDTLPDSVVEELRGHDGILLGAIGDPSVPSSTPVTRQPARRSAPKRDAWVRARCASRMPEMPRGKPR